MPLSPKTPLVSMTPAPTIVPTIAPICSRPPAFSNPGGSLGLPPGGLPGESPGGSSPVSLGLVELTKGAPPHVELAYPWVLHNCSGKSCTRLLSCTAPLRLGSLASMFYLRLYAKKDGGLERPKPYFGVQLYRNRCFSCFWGTRTDYEQNTIRRAGPAR